MTKYSKRTTEADHAARILKGLEERVTELEEESEAGGVHKFRDQRDGITVTDTVTIEVDDGN